MGKINAEGMSNFEAQRQKRKAFLTTLITTPFDLNNQQQQQVLKKYINEFEFLTNQMYLYQAGMSIGLSSWAIARFLPIPDFINCLLTVTLYFGISAYILEQFRMSEFNERLREMKTLYNWCLKNNQREYSATMDNTLTMAALPIQKLITLLAPLCETQFMIAWRREAEPDEIRNRTSWTRTFNAGVSAISSTFSGFSSNAAETTAEQLRIKELKIKVEKRSLDLNTVQGFKHALEYFTSSVEFKTLLSSKLQKSQAIIGQIIPSAMMNNCAIKLS